ncbi:MAG: SprB repeat-containing protein, partial [Acidobacteriota bacterium]
ANGFTTPTNAVTVTNPPALTASTSVTDDDVTVTASGGTGALIYSLDGGAALPNNQFFDLTNGVYAVIVEDANGCTAEATAVVAVNTLIVNAGVTQTIACFGNSTGTIMVSVGGGQPPYSFSLNGGVSQSSPVFSGLPAGTYSVEVVDMVGFSQMTNIVTLSNPAQIAASTQVTGYSVNVTASGGTGALTYSLDGGAFQSNNAFFPVPNGMHSVTIKDANGCLQTIPANVSVPTLTVAAAATHAISCFGGNNGEITATPGGGVSPYQFSLNGGAFTSNPVFTNLPAGSYSITMKDSGGFTVSSSTVTLAAPTQVTAAAVLLGYDIVATAGGGIPGYTFSLNGGAPQSSNIFADMPNGNHQITVSDANGCTASANISVNISPLQVVATIAQEVSCHDGSDGSIEVQVSGGIAPYQFRLNGGAWQSGNTFSNLPAGNYVLEVQDAGGLVIAAPMLVIDNPLAFVGFVYAFGSEVTFTVIEGGTGNFEYSLDGGAFQPSNVFAGVSNGTHDVTV